MTDYKYGQRPEYIGRFEPEWHEYMHYLYLPVDIPEKQHRVVLPRNLEFVRDMVEAAKFNELRVMGNQHDYIYVTARRGYASPGNPLNRPGWHADGFGSDDINYIWSDRWPTRFAIGEFTGISDDHIKSVEQFEQQIAVASSHEAIGEEPEIEIEEGEPYVLYRLDPSVIHATPIIPAPGGDRSFIKISFSNSRYNLLGNSHNYDLDYGWKMYSRSEIRNDPAYAGGDAGPQET